MAQLTFLAEADKSFPFVGDRTSMHFQIYLNVQKIKLRCHVENDVRTRMWVIMLQRFG